MAFAEPGRRCLAVIVAAAAGAGLLAGVGVRPVKATLPAPVVLNARAAQWAETQQLAKDGGRGGIRTFFATLLVRHAEGRTIDHVRADVNFDGTDDTTNPATNVPAAEPTFVAAAGGIQTSLVPVRITAAPEPTWFSCPIVGTR